MKYEKMSLNAFIEIMWADVCGTSFFILRFR